MGNGQYIDKVLNYLLTEDGRYYIDSTSFLLETLTNEYYILMYYITEVNKKNIRLTRELLELGLATNKMDWIDPRSKLTNGNDTLTKEYLQSKTSRRLEFPIDYATTLEQLVLSTYDKITSMDTPTDDEFLNIVHELRNVASLVLSSKIVQEVVPLIQGDKKSLYLDGWKYEKQDALEYIVNRAQKMLYSLSSSSTTTNRKQKIWHKMARNGIQLVPAIIWNLGKVVFSNPQPGFILSVIAPPKVGKTRFCVGEITYPALLLGRNVKYYSGEMEEHILRAMLVTKHIKYLLGQKLREATVQKVMVTASRIRTGEATKQEILYFEKVPANIKEYIILAENDLFYSGKYGILEVTHVGDTSSMDINVIPGEFILEEQHVLLKKEIERLPEGEKWDLVIQDHINHMRSKQGLKDAALLESYIQSAKAVASSNSHKLVYVIVNHLNTEQEKKIEENDSSEGLKLRGHGTNESGKSADIELVMYQTSQDKKDGTIHLQCTADRYVNIEETFKTNEFIIKADRAYCDYSFEGSGVKPPYPTVSQLKQIEEASMSSF